MHERESDRQTERERERAREREREKEREREREKESARERESERERERERARERERERDDQAFQAHHCVFQISEYPARALELAPLLKNDPPTGFQKVSLKTVKRISTLRPLRRP